MLKQVKQNYIKNLWPNLFVFTKYIFYGHLKILERGWAKTVTNTYQDCELWWSSQSELLRSLGDVTIQVHAVQVIQYEPNLRNNLSDLIKAHLYFNYLFEVTNYFKVVLNKQIVSLEGCTDPRREMTPKFHDNRSESDNWSKCYITEYFGSSICRKSNIDFELHVFLVPLNESILSKTN